MIRVLVFLVLAGLLALGVAWLADRPGEVAITWRGWRIETSVMVLVAIAAIAVARHYPVVAPRGLVRSPDSCSCSRAHAAAQGYQAISRGADRDRRWRCRAARKFAASRESLPGEPLALLLRAQTAQLTGDRAGAEDAFRAMAERADTRLLGLRGLYVEAQRRDDAWRRGCYAEEAAQGRAGARLGRAGGARISLRGRRLDRRARGARKQHRRAGCSTRRPTAASAPCCSPRARSSPRNTDRDARARARARSRKLAPTLVPAAALAGRLLAKPANCARRRGSSRRPGGPIRIPISPKPTRICASAIPRATGSKRVAASGAQGARPRRGRAGGRARRARCAGIRDGARALAPLAAAPTQRVALLMAELEELEHGDEGRAREWMARALNAARDPAWTADGFVSDRWLPVSPVTGGSTPSSGRCRSRNSATATACRCSSTWRRAARS